MRNGQTIAQRAQALGFNSKSDDLVHDLLDKIVTLTDARTSMKNQLIRMMEPTCRACKKSILSADQFVILYGNTYEVFFHEACAESFTKK